MVKKNKSASPHITKSDRGSGRRKQTNIRRKNTKAKSKIKRSLTNGKRVIAKIKVIGIGGSGGSIVSRMIKSKVQGVDCIIINTDLQALRYHSAHQKIQIGKKLTHGLGAGMNPNLGRQAAEENRNEIREAIKGADIIFLTCGLGGGTGTGATPLVAEIAHDLGILTIAVVTKPFTFEGKQRQIIAEAGFKELINRVDSIITIANDRLLEIIDKNTTLIHSFRMIDKILEESVRGVTDVINTPGLINIDFADIKAVMEQAGTASITIGQSTGENSLLQATKLAVTNPLLDNSVEGAKNAILIITGDKNLSMHEVNEATQMLVEMLDPQAKIIFGIVTDEQMKNKTKVTLIITGFEKDINQMHQTRPAFQTKKMEFYEQPTIKKIVEENNIEDQLDIPAFIRNKKLEK